MAHLRFRTTQTAAVMRVRDGMMREWHDWFEVSPSFFVILLLFSPEPCLTDASLLEEDMERDGGEGEKETS
jgi:hypothetical protein